MQVVLHKNARTPPAIRHLPMNLLQQEPSKLRLSQKRRKAAWNDDYRAKMVFG
jgi:hypothetical protein